MKKGIILLLSMIGLIEANTNIAKDKIELISNITEDTQLILEHSREFQALNNPIEVASHYSHRSHSSHRSHQSHYSHYSSYED